MSVAFKPAVDISDEHELILPLKSEKMLLLKVRRVKVPKRVVHCGTVKIEIH